MYKKKLQNEAISMPFLPPPASVCLTLPLPSPIIIVLGPLLISFYGACTPMGVLYGLPGSPGADSIPFPVAIVLSVSSFIAGMIRLGYVITTLTRVHGHFKLSSDQLWELVGSGISVIAALLLLGFVSSKSGTSNSSLL
jgi:prolipoprotein diacylglyceryltransferase